MSNNSSVCPPVHEWMQTSVINAKYFTYNIIIYPYFVFGLFGHGVFLFACYKKSKNENAFLCQMFLSMTRICEVISFTFVTVAFNLWAMESKSAQWFHRCYFCMWYAAHLCIPIVNGFINTSLFFLIYIALDRLVAISKPHFYREIWHCRKNRIRAYAVSLSLGFGIVFYDVCRFQLVNSEDTYNLVVDNFYRTNPLAAGFTILRTAALIIGVLVLCVFNAIAIFIHRSKMLKGPNLDTCDSISPSPKSIGRRKSSQHNTLADAKRREADHALSLLSICQATLNIVSMGSLSGWYITNYLAPPWIHCTGLLLLWAPIDDAIVQLAAVLDFYMALLICKPIRRMAFPWFHKRRKESVGLYVVGHISSSRRGTTETM